MKHLLLLLFLLLVSVISSGMVRAQSLSTRSFTNNDLGSDPNTLQVNGNQIIVDLSLLSGAEIYRATLDPYQRPERYFDIQNEFQYNVSNASITPYQIISATQDTLKLRPPRYLTFNATEAVQNALPGGELILTIYEDGQGIGETLSLDILCNLPAPEPIQQVTNSNARFEKGQTMITFTEVNPIVETQTWFQSEYLDAMENVYMHNISPKERYRIYRFDGQINSVEDILNAEMIDEIMPMSGWNYRSLLDDSGVIYTFPVDQMELSLPGTGFYLHTYKNEQPEEASYFVSYTVNGAEDFSQIIQGSNTTATVTEESGQGMVIKWKEEQITGGWYWWPDRNPLLRYYVRWEAPPYWNLPSWGFNYRVGLPNEEYQVDKPMLEITPHAWGGNYSGAYEWLSFEHGGVLLTQTHLHYNSYTAFNEYMCTLKPWNEGTVQPFYQARVSAFVYDFLVDEYNIDTNQIILTGGSMGGAAGHFWGMRNAEMFSYILSIVGNNIPDEDPCCVWEFENWGGYGKVDWALPFSNLQMVRFGHIPVYPEDNYNVWDYYDNTLWLEQNPAVETPFISFSNSVDDPAIGWEQAWKTANTVYDTKRPHVFTWGASGHYWPLGWEDIPTRQNQSVPAFSNCSLDDDLGEEPWMATEGQRNQYFRWDSATIVDEENKWEIDLWLDESAPENSCSADITPRRLQKFGTEASTYYYWETAGGFAMENGIVQSDTNGLITIEELVITKSVKRLTIEPYGVGISENANGIKIAVTPNPFTEDITISFKQVTGNPLKLQIVNIHSETVFEKLFDSQQRKIRAIKWNGNDLSGRKVPAGLYLLWLSDGTFSSSARIIRI